MFSLWGGFSSAGGNGTVSVVVGTQLAKGTARSTAAVVPRPKARAKRRTMRPVEVLSGVGRAPFQPALLSRLAPAVTVLLALLGMKPSRRSATASPYSHWTDDCAPRLNRL